MPKGDRSRVKEAVVAIDLFCGAGGSSVGAIKAHIAVVAGFDYWGTAQKTYKDNFPNAQVFSGKLEDLNPKEIARSLPRIDLILASPECTNHTCAKGNGGKDSDAEASRATAFQVIRFAKVLKPRWIVVENVIQMRFWKRYEEWRTQLQGLGYKITEQVLNAADFGVPQSRRRLYILCDKERKPPPVKPLRGKKNPASKVVNMNGKYPLSPLETPNRAAPTLVRARRAMTVVGKSVPFLLVYYSSDASGGWQSLNVPLRTITTLDRFALVKPGPKGHLMRMLQVDELKRAMGFPGWFKLKHGTRRDRIKLMGNAVCPRVMAGIVRQLVRNPSEKGSGQSNDNPREALAQRGR